MIYAENDNVVWVYKSNKWLVDVERSGGTPRHDPQEPQIHGVLMERLEGKTGNFIFRNNNVYKEVITEVEISDFIS